MKTYKVQYFRSGAKRNHIYTGSLSFVTEHAKQMKALMGDRLTYKIDEVK